MSETQEAPPAKRGHRTRWVVGAVVAILVIFVLFHIFAGKNPPKAAPPQVVKVSKASRGDMPETLSEPISVGRGAPEHGGTMRRAI